MSLPAMSRSSRAFRAMTRIGIPREASVWYSLTLRSEIRSSARPPNGMLMTAGSGCEVCRVPSVDMVCIGPGGYPPFLSAAVRFTLAALILGVAMALGLCKPRPHRGAVAWLGVAGLLNAVGYALVYRAEQEISGGIAAVLYGTMPLVTATIAGLTRTERLRPSAVAGALVVARGMAARADAGARSQFGQKVHPRTIQFGQAMQVAKAQVG